MGRGPILGGWGRKAVLAASEFVPAAPTVDPIYEQLQVDSLNDIHGHHSHLESTAKAVIVLSHFRNTECFI